MKVRNAFALAGVLVGGAAVAPTMAQAEERTCQGALGAITVDNLRVPQGAKCTLEGTIVKSTIKVERAATLIARGVRVVGNVQGENARDVRVVSGSQVGGSVQVKQGGAAVVRGSRVAADIQFDANRGALTAASNVVGGNVQVIGNRGGEIGRAHV